MTVLPVDPVAAGFAIAWWALRFAFGVAVVAGALYAAFVLAVWIAGEVRWHVYRPLVTRWHARRKARAEAVDQAMKRHPSGTQLS